ncbi:MAG TPA: hypothetical protein VKY74_28330 [Chloroflexia bacterium]|nr:hypothetical protein [Chloroflexia bacterium]
MEKVIAGNLMRLILDALRETSGPQFRAIMRQAGWEEYADHPPPDSDEPIASLEDFLRLTQTIYTMLGEDLYRLHQRNTGLKIAEGAIQGPWGAQIRAAALVVPHDQRLGWYVGEYAGYMAKAGVHYTIREEPAAWHMTLAHCPACPGIAAAKQPICTGIVVFMKKAGDLVMERRLQVAEVACHAVDGAACTFALYK